MKKYYTEEIELDAPHRKAYVDGIEKFLFEQREKEGRRNREGRKAIQKYKFYTNV